MQESSPRTISTSFLIGSYITIIKEVNKGPSSKKNLVSKLAEQYDTLQSSASMEVYERPNCTDIFRGTSPKTTAAMYISMEYGSVDGFAKRLIEGTTRSGLIKKVGSKYELGNLGKRFVKKNPRLYS